MGKGRKVAAGGWACANRGSRRSVVTTTDRSGGEPSGAQQRVVTSRERIGRGWGKQCAAQAHPVKPSLSHRLCALQDALGGTKRLRALPVELVEFRHLFTNHEWGRFVDTTVGTTANVRRPNSLARCG